MNPQNTLADFLFCVFLDSFLYIWNSFISETINYIFLLSLFLLMTQERWGEGFTDTGRLKLSQNWLIPKDNLPTNMPFIGKLTKPEIIPPTISLSNSHTPNQNFPYLKSSQNQVPGNKKPILQNKAWEELIKLVNSKLFILPSLPLPRKPQ